MDKLVGLAVIFIVVVVVMLFIVQQAWAWVVPDLLPGAVEQGLIAGEIGL